MRKFMMGNQVIAAGAKDAGATAMFGYPITPTTEIIETWAKFAKEDKKIIFLQTEDEMAAGFAAIGACMAGAIAFTATAGPGNILFQDAAIMAEALRIPLVAIIGQRGGMSTSTVIYSQQEVRLTCFGGNGEGFRIVYSIANLQELYDYTKKAFTSAWKYRFPAFILADGYQCKMKGEVNIPEILSPPLKIAPILKPGENWRNCYNLEEEVGNLMLDYADDYAKARPEIEESETFLMEDAQIVIVTHGIVSAAAKKAVQELRKKGHRIGLFRPITIRPFPANEATKSMEKIRKIVIIESALGQLAEIFKSELYWLSAPLIEIGKPGIGFTPEEIVQTIIDLPK